MENKNVKRTDLINHLISTYNLKSYCELGTQTRAQNFDKIICDEKFCVDIDPNSNADFIGSTDDFFKTLNRNYDIFFIDASHVADDVRRDFENCLSHCNKNSFIVLHDCNPLKEEHTIVPRPKPTGHWHGDVFQFAWRLFKEKNFRVVDIDCGCGVYSGNQSPNIVLSEKPIEWIDFETHRKELLKLTTWDEFIASHSKKKTGEGHV